jgi:hypothetical protein
MFGMIVVLLVVVILASDYVRRKKGLDYEEIPKELPPMFEEDLSYLSLRGQFYWGDPLWRNHLDDE